MTDLINFPAPPPLVIGESDHRAISALIDSAQGAAFHENLQTEIDRARIAPDGAIPVNVVRMGSFVRFRTSDGQTRDVQLVWPRDADIAAGRISVLTPVGTALIGLAAGQAITWTGRNGKRQALTVLEVRPPESHDNDDGGHGGGPAAA